VNGPEPGMRVVNIRGAFIGYISEVTESAVLITPEADGEEYWLKCDAILGVDGQRVELICDSSEIHRYRVENEAG
jgi:hypothetical protein